MRKMWSKSSKRRSMATASKSANGDESHSLADTIEQEPSAVSHVRSLIDLEYDTKSAKHAWLNGVINASPMQDFNESSLRLYRVELRGSHLYIYRPPSSLNVRSFKLDLKPPSADNVPPQESEATSFAASDQGTSLAKKESVCDFTMATSSSTLASASDLSSIGNGPLTQSSNTKHSVASASSATYPVVPVPENITYSSPKLPHPELQFDFSSDSFVSSSSIEALVHFFVFADSQKQAKSIRQLTTTFPLLPRFGSILKLLLLYLQAVYGGKFVGYKPGADLCERVVALLQHVDDHFSGFLLQSDVAPSIPKILQCLTGSDSVGSLNSIPRLQDSIITKQQELLRLIGNVNSKPDSPSMENVFADLSSHKFLHSMNLLDLVAAITEIDWLFFQTWNSSLDKSLLLFTSVCEGSPGDYFYKKNSLIFNNDTHIHYLSRLFIHHLFVENSYSAPEKLARLLEKWIDLGCLLDKSGNMSSWLGVASIILSQPVLRLTAVWTFVGEDYIKLLKNDWSPVLFELDRRHLANTNEPLVFEGVADASSKSETLSNFKESYHIMAPRGLGKIYPKEKVIPYFGDLLVNNTKSTNIADLETIWRKITYSFERWKEYLRNLPNSPEIIAYNQDVLRRYDSMGFIFSNESLNQVLYLGVNKDDGKAIPSLSKMSSELKSSSLMEAGQGNLLRNLFRLLEYNCESINLETVMAYSLHLEPGFKESYLKPPAAGVLEFPSKDCSKDTLSELSVDSASSSTNRTSPERSVHSKTEISPEDKLPAFNLEYYKIDITRYDDLVPQSGEGESGFGDSHNVVVDNQLVLRVDDFIGDFEGSVTPVTSNGESDRPRADEDGLGIDVDDIMNSDKFNNFAIPSDSEADDNSSAKKKHFSFGILSHHSNYGLHSKPDRYVPRFATMDKLIDLLLIDSKHFDENHPINLTEYRYVFMLSYSSFITTNDLLQRLAQRFINSGNAVISVMKRQFLKQQGTYDSVTFGAFPKWATDDNVDLSQLGEVDYELLLQIQTNILKVLIFLLNNFFESFSNDLNNKTIMIKLLKLYSNEILQWYNSNKIERHLSESFERLVDLYKRLKKLFIRKSYRPVEASKFDVFLTRQFQFSKRMKEVPMNRNLPSHKNIHKVEKFLNKFNKLLAIFYQGITPENWLAIFKILENSFSNYSLLNYDIQTTSTPEEVLKIGDIFTYLETLYDTDPKDKVLNKFPLVFKKLFKLYLKFKGYLLIQLCDESIGSDERLERMKTLLLMVQISRLKMKDSQFVFEGDRSEIPSCVETAILSVIYSPESRSLLQLWVKLRTNSNDSASTAHLQKRDSLESLLPDNIKQSDLLAGTEPLLPCFGWIIQNLVNMNRCPSFHRNTINFNKRYFLFKLIKELNVEEIRSIELHKDTKEFEFLLNLDETVGMRGLSADFAGHLSSSMFESVIKRQHSIIIEDERKRRLATMRTTSTSEPMHASINSTSTNLKRQSMAYKTPSSSRFKISGLFNKSRSFGHANAYERAVTYNELPDPINATDPRQKPVLVIQLKDRKIFPVYLLPYCFKIDTNNSNEACFFQSSNEADAKDWLRNLNHANRHWFMSKSINLKNDHAYTTFGVPLATTCVRDGAESPAVLDLIYDAIEKDGLKEVGIYRISTSFSELSSIKQEVNRTGTINLRDRHIDVHTLTSCVKSFFRELPDALLTDQVIESLFPLKRPASESHNLSASDAHAFRSALSSLPRENYCTLKSLVRHLTRVVNENEANKMTCSNLATVIGPALTEASNLESLINNFGLMNHMLERMIENYGAIFEPCELEV